MEEQSIEKIYEILQKNSGGWEVKRYSDKTEYLNLWSIDEGGGQLAEKIIVIWDKYPHSETRNIAWQQENTPIDWADWAKCQDEKLNIVIVDILSHDPQGEYDKKRKKHHKEVLSKMAKWVKFYSFNKKDFGDSVLCPLSILDDIKGMKDDGA